MKIERITEKFPIKANFAKALFEWGKRLDKMGWRGSLAYRHGLGFVITGKDAVPGQLTENDLIFVEDNGEGTLKIRGTGLPPSEATLHSQAFHGRSSVIFSFLME